MDTAKKIRGIVEFHDVTTGSKCYLDTEFVRGVAKDYERVGAAILLLKSGGHLKVNESYKTIYEQLYDKPSVL